MGELKEDLARRAEEAGLAVESDDTKTDIERKLDTAAPPALGPTVEPGQTAPEIQPQGGTSVTGVQPMTDDDIPDAGR